MVAFKTVSLRSLPPAKVHFYLQTWIDVSVPHSCSGKVSPSTANNSADARQARPAASASPSVAPFHACREAAVCVCALLCVRERVCPCAAPCAPLTALDRQKEPVRCGATFLLQPIQVLRRSGGAVTKPGPDAARNGCHPSDD